MSATARRTVARVRTHAKVNLFLRVLGPRPDGYHEIETILHGIAVADELEFRVTSGRIEVAMNGAAPGVAAEDNLVWIAATHLRDRTGRRWGASVEIAKAIPAGAGLGGGSSNAAGALVVLNELWNGGLAPEALRDLAGAIGSDVPYCIDGGTALATSRGEVLTPLVTTRDLWLVLGLPLEPMLTRDVYAAWIPGHSESVGSAAMVMALGAGDAAEVARLLHNDLEPAAFALRPALAEGKRALVEAGALGAGMSGSGPTLFGMARDREHAHEVARRVRSCFDRVIVTKSFTPCIERL